MKNIEKRKEQNLIMLIKFYGNFFYIFYIVKSTLLNKDFPY